MPNPDDVRLDPQRLEALHRLGLLDAPQQESFDQFTRLAVELLEVPAAFVSLVDADRDFYLSQCGFGEPLATTRQLTGQTFCHFAIESEGPLVIPDTRADPRYREVPTVESLGVAAYVGVPLRLPTREVLGSFCVIDLKPHPWSEREIRVLERLAHAVATEVALRAEIASRTRAEAELARSATRLQEQAVAMQSQLEQSQALAKELEEANERLQQSEQRLTQILQTLPTAVILGDADGRIVWHNLEAERTWGEVPAVGPDGYDVFKGWWADTGEPISADEWAVARALKGETPPGQVINIQSFDGRRLTILNHAAPLRDETGRVTGIVWVHEDITEYRALEEQFRQAQKLEAVGRLAGGVAHDFNNLLTVITGHAQLLRMEEELSQVQRSYLEEILRAATRSAELTHQLLAYSRRQVLQPRRVDLSQVVLDTMRLLQRLLGEDVQIHTVLAPRLKPVFVDPGQMGQVLMNLAVNARDAMPQGGELTIRTDRLELTQARRHGEVQIDPGDYVVLSVSDTGEGMSPETQEWIFEPFFTTKPAGAGTGLGLATVYGIVSQSGGNIWVESEPGKGSTFYIALPAGREASETSPGAEQAEAPIVGGRGRVLLVEDEPAVRSLIRTVLERVGYTVLQAAGMREALALLEQAETPVDLLLTDVVMPGGSGRELAEQARAAHPRMEVIFMSGYTDEAVERHGVLASGTHFLQKPFTPAQLSRVVGEVLGGIAGPRPGER